MKALVKTALCPLHAQPDAHSELADEVLYGMTVELLERMGPDWYRVRTHYRYEGFAPADCLLPGDDSADSWQSLPKRTVLSKNTCDVMAAPKVQSYPLITLTLGALLSPVGEAEEGWQKVLLCDGRTGHVRASLLGPHHAAPPTRDEAALRALIVENALRYQGTHYRWGGKSPLGIDCSGLTSMAYLLSGILIFRDARMEEGFPIHPIGLEQAKPGDLLYFPGHIALYLGDGQYVHSTGHAGDDGFARNSLDPGHPNYRADLAARLTAVGSYF